jgi:hypothetical protein
VGIVALFQALWFLLFLQPKVIAWSQSAFQQEGTHALLVFQPTRQLLRRNISAVHLPIPFTLVSISITASSGSLPIRSSRTVPSSDLWAGVTDVPAVFFVKLGNVSELGYTKNGLFVMLG